MKTCICCGSRKTLDSFYNRKVGSKDGKHSYCKDCHNKKNKLSAKKYRETKKYKKWAKEHYYHYRRTEKFRKWHREYRRKQRREGGGKEQAQRRKIDSHKRENPKYRVDMNMSRAIRAALNGNKAGRTWESLVGYSLFNLVGHLERQFTPEMNWDNYGSYWHIDHKKPRSSFSFNDTNSNEFKKCWSLENLQPMEAIENIKKGNKIWS